MQEHLEAVNRMQDYINQHLYEEINLTELSKISLFSPWYSHRLFTQIVGYTIADYIRKLRLTKSVLKLRDDSDKITTIAFEIGFKSVDGYQRAFFREFGYTPKEYASNPVPLNLFIPYPVNLNIERRISLENVKTVFIQMVEKPKRKVLIKRGVKATEYFSYCEEVGCDVWGLLTSIKALAGEPICLWLSPQYIEANTSKYVQGVEVPLDYNGVVPESFDVIELPAAKYLMFKGEAFAEEEYKEAIEELQVAIAKYDPTIVGLAWDESNPRIQLEPIGTRGYIELMPVK